MGRRYTYDCVMTHEEDGWVVSFPQLPEAYTDGDTREEALANAAEVLTLAVGGRVRAGEAVPAYERSAEVVAVSVDLTDERVEELGYTTIAEAAEYLGVTRPRVSALIKAGVLADKWFDGAHEVSIESLNRYRDSPRKAGRPRRETVPA